jgi:hypothetical protein
MPKAISTIARPSSGLTPILSINPVVIFLAFSPISTSPPLPLASLWASPLACDWPGHFALPIRLQVSIGLANGGAFFPPFFAVRGPTFLSGIGVLTDTRAPSCEIVMNINDDLPKLR